MSIHNELSNIISAANTVEEESTGSQQKIIPIIRNTGGNEFPNLEFGNFNTSPNSINNNNNNNNNIGSPTSGVERTSSTNSGSHFSPYSHKPSMSLTKDKIPFHLQHYMNTPTFDRNEEDIREITPVSIKSLFNNGPNPTTNPNTTSPTIGNNGVVSPMPTLSSPPVTTTTTTTTSVPFNNNTRSPSSSSINNPHNTSIDQGDDSSDNDSPSSPNNNSAVVTVPNANNALATIPPADGSLAKAGQSYIEITEYLNFPQSEAAKKLGMPTSTLSKRWKEAARGRKWPFRKLSKIDKEIMTLLHNIPPGGHPDLPPDVDAALVTLLKKRQNKLRPVFIRM
eukprot:gene4876-6082_t